MAKIFISYRREDAKYPANRLHGALKPYVANPRADIFIDIDNIPAGVDFVEHLNGRVGECQVLLAVIGAGWLEARNAEGGRRLDDPDDFVRIEIAAALKRVIPVVPVLLDGVGVPRADQLPDELKPLTRRNGVPVRLESFEADVARLVERLPVGLPLKGRATPKAATGEKSARPWLIGLAALVFLGGGIGGLFAAGILPPGAGEEPVQTVAEAPTRQPEAPALADVAGLIPETVPEPLVPEETAPTAASPAPADPMGTAAERSAAIRTLQTALRTLGHYTGGVDGAAGPGTQGALAAFGREERVSVPASLASAPLAELANMASRAESASADYIRREASAWRVASAGNTKAAYEAYLADYERGTNAATARQRIAAIDAAARAPAPARTEPAPQPTPVASTTRRVGDVFRDRFTSGTGQGPEMVVLPSGSFTMGSPSTESGRDSDEGPQRTVRIGYQFAVGKYEVTVAQYRAFAEETGRAAGGNCYTVDQSGTWSQSAEANWRNPGFSQSGTHPVVCVNWDDAQAYVEWLSRKTGQGYRLLSEAEWEYAARAGTTTPYSFGSDANRGCGHMNGADATAKRTYASWTTMSCDDGYLNTAPVGSFAANPFKLHDMHGNVWEWTHDCWNGSYTGAPSDGSASTSGECARRVLRGGSWSNDPQDLRSAFRVGSSASNRDFYIGFRVARTL